MKKDTVRSLILLQLLLLVMAFSGVLSKLASQQPFMSLPFVLLYGGMLFLLVVYAVGWQQVLKRLDLSVAYANRAFALSYSLLFGALIFKEQITVNKVLGCALAITGALLYVSDSQETANGASAAEDAAQPREREESEETADDT